MSVALLLLSMMNDHRSVLLIHDPELSIIAQTHANAMDRRGRLWHQSMRNIKGYRFVGENIARADSPESVMKMWMRSPGHRANIKSKRYTHAGIGHSGRYWCVCFGGG